MLRLLVPCLIWLSSVRSETGIYPHMTESGMMAHKMPLMMDTELLKPKRESVPHPCPPIYHGISYQPSIYAKPYEDKNEVTVHQMHSQIQLVHQPSYTPVIVKPAVTYVKPMINYHQPAYAKPMVNYHQPAYVQPKVIYQKPVYSYAPIYHKPMYDMPKIMLKKYENPVTAVVYQKPMMLAYKQAHPVSYIPPPVHVPAPAVSYIKVPAPMVHHPAPTYVPAPVHAPPIVKIPEVVPIKPYCP